MSDTDYQATTASMSAAGLDLSLAMVDAFQDFARRLGAAGMPPAGLPTCGCEIPPACWQPRCFGVHDSRACRCGTALLRLRVTNCRNADSEVAVQLAGSEDLEVKITPQKATLGPMERKWFTVAVGIPEDACEGKLYDLVVWVRGCNEHYGRWNVRVADGASGTCRRVDIDDCPDYVHHWYDHFYCVRPCFSHRDKRKEGQ